TNPVMAPDTPERFLQRLLHAAVPNRFRRVGRQLLAKQSTAGVAPAPENSFSSARRPFKSPAHAEGASPLGSGSASGPHVLANNLAVAVEDAEGDGPGMEIDTAGESVRCGVKAHHGLRGLGRRAEPASWLTRPDRV